ncbi:MAG: hypothetical protein OEN23_05735 [Paracoccaceae bacterium]|nr:hypothetical protein [Paracoccaceae bacterium]
MRDADKPALEGEILGNEIPDPGTREVTPGWITRNRDLIRKGQSVARALIVVAPPPARLALAAASTAADGLLLAADFRRGLIDGKTAGVRAGEVALEGAAIIAATRLAPQFFSRHHRKLAAAQSVLRRVQPAPCG